MCNKQMRRSTILLSICLLLTQTGCWDVEEINMRGSANVIFFDVGTTANTKFGGVFNIPGTVLPPMGATEQQFEKRNFTLTGEGNGALDAWRNMQTNATRNVYFGQISAVIISEDFARNGDLNNSLDFIGRLNNVNSTAHLLLTKSDPEELLDIKLLNNILPGNYINMFMQSPSKKMLAIPVTLWQVFRDIDAGTADIVMPMIEVQQEQYRITGTALFSRNQMVGELDMYETGSLAMLRGVKDGYLTVPLPNGGVLSLSEVSSKSKISPHYDQQKNLSFNIKTTITTDIAETIPREPEITLADQKRYEKLVEAYTTTQITNLLVKLQKLNCDPVGLGGGFRAQNLKDWEKVNWHELYPTVTINVATDVRIKATGTLR